ncbi:Alpha/Beta hydrolase protein [Xylaria bambusicola]|uniref:Alpha/Beta hydrolase protein n=1 Tax=Xylaria bambusicola TaxID=326684 RepID=UPI0020088776|nr:Alpha/Beta hydrolase protein [Xylaria bambusicola]KAI0505625.1 Alpha/Beta hydrolase protein [Xylaria bambusicola]
MLPQVPLYLAALSNWTQAPSSCQDLRIPVSVEKTAEGEFGSDVVYNDEVLFALAGRKILVSNTYEMSGRFCAPDDEQSPHADTLQLLVHGASFNKNMWESQLKPERYNWVRRMNFEGYPTLAVDLIGSGNSSFPDGLYEVQSQMYVETIHDLIQKLRRGEVDGRKWEKIVLVGFSIGGMLANALAQQYPDDVDALVLHAITWDTSWIYPAFLSGLQVSAAQVDPVKWGHIPLMYQTQSTPEGRRVACFAGAYEEDAVEYDFHQRDFDTLGAAITFTYLLGEAPEYTRPVFLGIGEQDSTFCGGRFCREQPWAVYRKFENAAAIDVKVYPETGHLILYHHSGLALMADSLAFLETHGF